MTTNPPIILSTTPTWIRPFICDGEEFPVQARGRIYNCLVIDASFGVSQGAPSIFAINHSSGVLGISSDYPKEWRELGMFHELMPHGDHSGSCLAALLDELGLAKERGLDLSAYKAFREKFFGDTAEYYRDKSPREPGENLLLEQLDLSHRFLRDHPGP